MGPEDFYEPDEPAEDVRAAFEAGDKGLTRLPAGARLITPPPSYVTGVTRTPELPPGMSPRLPASVHAAGSTTGTFAGGLAR